MSATHLLIELLGSVGLLLWGVHVVNNGVQRVFGSQLRQIIGEGLGNRYAALLAGLVVTALLQSSTATALMISSFSGAGTLELAPALAVLLGANIGTTLIVQFVSFDISYVFPLLIFIGVAVYRRAQSNRIRGLSQALIGLGLMLLALHLLVGTLQPLEASSTLRMVIGLITQDAAIALLVATALSWSAHSSVAAMLFVMSLAGTHVISTQAALAMMLGCNLGSALNPLMDALGGGPAKLRAPLGNFVMRVVGAVLVFPFLGRLATAASGLGIGPAQLTALAHLAFNLAVAALFLGILPWFADLLLKWLPEKQAAGDPAQPLYLDEAALSTPSVALTNAAREVLHMADVVEEMLGASQAVFSQDDIDKVQAVSRTDDVLDRLYDAVQLYIGAIDQAELDDKESQRIFATLSLAINLEHIGDIIDKNLMEMAAQRIRDRRRLPPAAVTRIEGMHAQLREHLRLALAVYISGDAQAAPPPRRREGEFSRPGTRGHSSAFPGNPFRPARSDRDQRLAARHHS